MKLFPIIALSLLGTAESVKPAPQLQGSVGSSLTITLTKVTNALRPNIASNTVRVSLDGVADEYGKQRLR